MYMIMFVLDDNSCLNRILKSWSDLGISGATIAETSGLHRQQVKHIPMRYTYGDSPTDEIGNTTLFAIVKNEKMARSCLEAIEKIVGDLDTPNTGVFSAWPLAIIKGIPSQGKSNEG